MSVRDALPPRNGAGPGTAVAPAEAALPMNMPEQGMSLIEVITTAIEQQTEAFTVLLPAGSDPARFSRLVLIAIKSTPDLMKCFDSPEGRSSILFAGLQAATVNLEPNTPTQDGWLLPRPRKIKATRNSPEREVMEAEFAIGYRGLLKLMRRGNNVMDVRARAVRQHDLFDYEYGLDEKLVHRPAPAGERGDLTHVWALVKFLNGGTSWVVMDKEQVHKRREFSKSWKSERARPYSPWTVWTDEMWCKTGLRELSKIVEMDPWAAAALLNDEQTLRFDPLRQALVSAEPAPWDEPDNEPSTPITVTATPTTAPPPAAATTPAGTPPPAGPPPAAGDELTINTLADLATWKGVLEPIESLGKRRAKLVRAASDYFGTEYTAAQLEADEGALTLYRNHLNSLPDAQAAG